MSMTNSLKYSKNYPPDGFSSGYRPGFSSRASTKEPSHQNHNLYSPTSTSSGQIFYRERVGRLKWKDIISLDIDNMVKISDLTPLENYIDNLIYSVIDEND